MQLPAVLPVLPELPVDVLATVEPPSVPVLPLEVPTVVVVVLPDEERDEEPDEELLWEVELLPPVVVPPLVVPPSSITPTVWRQQPPSATTHTAIATWIFTMVANALSNRCAARLAPPTGRKHWTVERSSRPQVVEI
jgi:hypothetical protein